ncbi:MAG: hypothetical protein ACM3SY_18835 [Candidatus Omnitrophota bacterium]
MGAFWHLFVPLAVSITIEKEEFEAIPENESLLPQPFANDFFEVSRREREETTTYLGTRHKINLTFMPTDENLEQVKPFLIEAWKLIQAEDDSIIPEDLNQFIDDSLTPLSITRASIDEVGKTLEEMMDNYYLRYESLASMVVYHGWPTELRSRSRDYSMRGFIFLHSYEKMNVIPEETVLFYNLRDKIRKELSSKYAIAKYVYTVGF